VHGFDPALNRQSSLNLNDGHKSALKRDQDFQRQFNFVKLDRGVFGVAQSLHQQFKALSAIKQHLAISGFQDNRVLSGGSMLIQIDVSFGADNGLDARTADFRLEFLQ
jgi:hypothetical protein